MRVTCATKTNLSQVSNKFGEKIREQFGRK